MHGRAAELAIAVRIIEHGLTVLAQEHVYVHAVAGLTVDGLRHQCGRHAVRGGRIADDVFRGHRGVCQTGHLAQLDLDLQLAGAADLVVVILDVHAPLGKLQTDLVAQVKRAVAGQIGVVAIVRAGVKAVVREFPGGPDGLAALQAVADGIRAQGARHAVKDMEFILWSDDHLVRDAESLHVGDGALGDIARILVERAVCRMVDDHDIADHRERRRLDERVDNGRCDVRQEDHVAALDLRVAIVRAVEADAVRHDVLVEAGCGDGQVLPPAAKVDHLEIEKCDAVLADKILDLLYILKHEGSSCSHNFRGDSPNSERLRLVKMTEILDLCSSAL